MKIRPFFVLHFSFPRKIIKAVRGHGHQGHHHRHDHPSDFYNLSFESRCSLKAYLKKSVKTQGVRFSVFQADVFVQIRVLCAILKALQMRKKTDIVSERCAII